MPLLILKLAVGHLLNFRHIDAVFHKLLQAFCPLLHARAPLMEIPVAGLPVLFEIFILLIVFDLPYCLVCAFLSQTHVQILYFCAFLVHLHF